MVNGTFLKSRAGFKQNLATFLVGSFWECQVGRKGATKVSLRSRRDRSRKEIFGRVDAFSRAFAAKTFTHAKTIPPATQARRKFSSTDGRAVPVLTRPFLKGQANAGF